VKRKAKQSGSGGRLRLALLGATVAAFLLVPAAQAFAANPEVHIIFGGEGAGWVKGNAPEGEGGGTPRIECHGTAGARDGTPPAICDSETDNVGVLGVQLIAQADPGSELTGWEVQAPGAAFGGCQNPVETQTEECAAVTFGGAYSVKAIFALKSEPLNLTVSGAAGGEVECKINGGTKGSCPFEAPVGKSVEVFPTGTGVELEEWTTGPCELTNDNPCAFTMPEAEVSANAAFKVASETLSVTKTGGGTGTVTCEDNGGGCSGTALYGHTIKVTAAPDTENVVEKIDATGSASGHCSVALGGVSGECEFVIHQGSTVTVYFESAGTKSPAEVETVHGRVLQKTALESSCPSVDLTPGSSSFLPGVPADYNNNCHLTLTSTGTESKLFAGDESATHTGHLVQAGPPLYWLPSLLEAGAEDEEEKGTPMTITLAPLNSTPGFANAITLLTFPEPISKDGATLEFNQHIGEHDGLHHGEYAKTITLTLEQTNP
jgi:hypothetical protein